MLRKSIANLTTVAVLAFAATASLAADTGYTYDTLGRVIRVDYPNGNSTLYSYDAAGNRTAVSSSTLSSQPTAVDDPFPSTNENVAVTYDPLANDVSATAMSIIATGAPLHGSVSINGSRTLLTYTPAAGYFGTDTFFYTIANGSGGQSYALDTITVVQTFPLPTASPFGQSTNANTPVTFDPRLHATGDTLTNYGTPTASHGSVVNNAGASLTYTPATSYVGGDSFTYTVQDSHAQFASNTVTITVNAPTPPAPPCNQTFPNPPRTAHVFDCRADASLTMTAISPPSEGDTVLAADGTSITFTPAAGQCGDFDFTYTVKNIYNVYNTGSGTLSVGPRPCP